LCNLISELAACASGQDENRHVTPPEKIPALRQRAPIS
jgi:hypothetical protein